MIVAFYYAIKEGRQVSKPNNKSNPLWEDINSETLAAVIQTHSLQ